MGFLTPIVMFAKALMQCIWTLGISWDERLPPEICHTWSNFMTSLPSVSDIKISRHLPLVTAVNIQLHGFCDASQTGYGCCVYLRCVQADHSVTIQLLIAKSRVAPLKQISLPRLELCGAHLLSKLMKYCFDKLSQTFTIDLIGAWCDSTIVLSWIQTPSYRLKTYVANRVSEIQENIPPHAWRHVQSNDNPADCASRGILPHLLIDHSLWWYGPIWLKENPEKWKQSSFTPVAHEALPELKPNSFDVLNIVVKPFSLWSNYSSWTKLLHVVAIHLECCSLQRCYAGELQHCAEEGCTSAQR